jgi:hypothetical protein
MHSPSQDDTAARLPIVILLARRHLDRQLLLTARPGQEVTEKSLTIEEAVNLSSSYLPEAPLAIASARPSMANLLRIPNPRSTLLMICDVQERFRP